MSFGAACSRTRLERLAERRDARLRLRHSSSLSLSRSSMACFFAFISRLAIIAALPARLRPARSAGCGAGRCRPRRGGRVGTGGGGAAGASARASKRRAASCPGRSPRPPAALRLLSRSMNSGTRVGGRVAGRAADPRSPPAPSTTAPDSRAMRRDRHVEEQQQPPPANSSQNQSGCRLAENAGSLAEHVAGRSAASAQRLVARPRRSCRR